MNEKINIIIVDSGVKTNHVNFINEQIIGYSFSENGIMDDFEDEYGHGTAIFNIINESKIYANITNIKLNNIDNGITCSILQSLLNYIYINEKADIINLSLGLDVCEDIKSLEEIVNKITSSGTIIISAFDNSGSISYPAAFNNVIGVVTGHYCNKINDFEYIEDDIINIAAKGNLQKVAWINPDHLLLKGNSFACAHVTVQVANFIKEGYKTKEEILQKFKQISKKQYILPQNKNQINLLKIKKAALFPFNKEMHSLIRYQNLLNFDIVDVYDSKYSATIGATTSHLMKDKKVKCLTIKDINNVNWDAIDTLILGHTSELSTLLNKKDIKYTIINDAIKHNKQIFSFDDLSPLGYHNCHNIFYPKVDQNDLPPKRNGMLYRFSKPIVGIFGTSSQQGKFTLQLKLRELLSNHGYNIGQVGTEPSALLYGMDYCFPMGYNSSVFIKEFDTVRYLNFIINDLCLKNKDIILVGSQSGTIPYDTGNIVQYTMPQFNFIMGTQPDCVILCVNPFDEFDYIKRTISFIESSVNCKVISIVIFPMDIKNNWAGIYGSKKELDEHKYKILKNKLYDHFNIPIFKLGNENNMIDLVDVIINFFS